MLDTLITILAPFLLGGILVWRFKSKQAKEKEALQAVQNKLMSLDDEKLVNDLLLKAEEALRKAEMGKKDVLTPEENADYFNKLKSDS
jgi:hypothetical protein